MRRYVMERLKDLYAEWSTLFDRRPKTVELYQDAREIGDFVQRFRPVLLCADCTRAESEVRRKMDADPYFTLRPIELRDALIVKAGMPHSLSRERVQELAELYEHTWHRVVLARKQLVEVALGAVITGSDDWRPALGEGREAMQENMSTNCSGDGPTADPHADATDSAPSPWSDTEDQELATRYAAGSDIREIAQEINRSPLAVWRRLAHLGLMPQPSDSVD